MDKKQQHLKQEKVNRIVINIDRIIMEIIHLEQLMEVYEIETPHPEIHNVINDLGEIRNHIGESK